MKKLFATLPILALLAGLYYLFVAKLPQESYTTEQLISRYDYSASPEQFRFIDNEQNKQRFSFKSFDGEMVYGQIIYPDSDAKQYPVLLGLHAMGRSYPRWFTDSLRGRPTVTNVDKITLAALEKGYAVIAIDARFHGQRKQADKPLSTIWNDMNFLGDKTDYESMIVNTAIDNRLLLDWIASQPNLDSNNIDVAGYSMGGQIALLLAALDHRIDDVVSIVPPYVEDTVAMVAPKNFATMIADNRVLLITGKNDDVGSPEQYQSLLDDITSATKRHVALDADHILPASYVDIVSKWLG